jgi:hypothetical protein
MRGMILGAVLAMVAGVAGAQSPLDQILIERLQSGDSNARRQVSRDVYGTGRSAPALWDAIAAYLDAGMPGLQRKDDRGDEFAWHTKALAASGDLKYRPLIERATQHQNETLAGHAARALVTLDEQAAKGRPLLTQDKIRVLSETEAATCTYITQRTCETRKDMDACMESHRRDAFNAGADSMLILNASGKSGGMLGQNFLGLGMGIMTASYYRCSG